MDEERICSKCGKKKPVSAFPNYAWNRCRLCYNAYKRDYDARHPEKIRAINRKSYVKHREGRKAYSKAYTRKRRAERKRSVSGING